jgi:hypothetical protein
MRDKCRAVLAYKRTAQNIFLLTLRQQDNPSDVVVSPHGLLWVCGPQFGDHWSRAMCLA